MIVYSVSVVVDQAVVAEWQAWMLKVHIPDVMATGHFTGHQFARVIEPTSDVGRIAFRIDYSCESMQNYEQYRDHNAAALQREHTEKYDGRFTASRQILSCGLS